MVDWQKLVRERLSGLALDAAEKDDVQRELAAHLEESYDVFCKEGLSEKEAMDRTMEKVSDWRDLQRKVFFAKRKGDLVRKRFNQLWFPGFLTFILSTALLMTLQKIGFRPHNVWSSSGAILVYLPWLAGLPFVGALGAYLSSRAGGSRAAALLASLFPVLALATAFLLMFPIGWSIQQVAGIGADSPMVASALLRDGIGWLLVPGSALLAGGLLVRVLLDRRPSSPDTATG